VDGNVIPGLYAAGEMVGGLFYFNYPGGAGLTSAAVIGRLAARSAVRHAADGLVHEHLAGPPAQA
jgi:tricarballylate dehydrogenase